MKKILLFTAVMTFAANSFANDERNGFYVKGAIGGILVKNIYEKINDSEFEATFLDSNPIKFKPKIDAYYLLGVGYYFNNMFRTAFSINYTPVSFYNPVLRIKTVNQDDEQLFLNTSYKRKANIYSALINGYFDIDIMNKTQFFLGGGWV